jgi:type IV pilus assembly protein PilY1
MRYKKSRSNRWHTLSTAALTALFACASSTAFSDDIQVYVQPPPNPVPPNILFVLDESESMSEDNPTRRDVLVNALKAVFEDDAMGNVNTALLGYSTRGIYAHSGPFKVISEGSNKALFLGQIDNLGTRGSTPTVKAMDAAVNWFRSDATFTDANNVTLTSPLTEDGVRAEDMRCAPNHIILLSDGAPNCNNYSQYNGANCSTNNLFNVGNWEKRLGYSIPGDRCATEIAAWANTTDLMKGAGWDDVQNITVSTMGFYTSGDTRTFLERVAEAGGGKYYHSSGDTLVKDLTDIITGAKVSVDYAYNAPSIPFNSDYATVTGNEIYVPMFLPDTNGFWKGNLKKYNISVTEENVILTALGNERVLDDAQKFQSTRDLFCKDDPCVADEGKPLVGGAAQDMTEVRNLYTYLGNNPDLTSEANRVSNSNTAITTTLLGVTTEASRTELLNWITRDPDYVATKDNPSYAGKMGAPIHTRPIVVDYGDNDVVLLPTSEGVLEAIDAKSGEELWAFMPQDLLAGIRTIKRNDASSIPYYGLDGPMTYYEIGGKKMVIFGMRRGGRKYHILNITKRSTPEYVAEISGDASSDFSKLGQTWSKPLYVKMEINGVVREILVFGGGYDPDQDKATPPAEGYTDDEGNAIFIVDAATGTLLISISNTGADVNIPEMTNAIPSDIATIDLNGNAIVDRLYVSDVGGRIIRIDIDDDATNDTSTITGGIIANINKGKGASAHRKFFTTPQIGYYSKAGRQFLSILIGTGDIANPLDQPSKSTTETDRFYMIKDTYVWAPPDWDDFVVTTGDHFTDASNTTVNAFDSRGWYIDYSATEKSFSKAILYDYAIFFTTYSSEIDVPDSLCEAIGTIGTARVYGIDLLTANAAIHWDGKTEDVLTISDRSSELQLQGIPPSPALIFPGGTDADGNTVIGKKIFLFTDLKKKYEWSDRLRPVYWEEVFSE